MNSNLIIHSDEYHSYLNSNNEEVLNLFFENRELDQLQILLLDENPQIRNKKLIVKPNQITNAISTSHEKHFKRDNKEIIEYYYDNVLDYYAEVERLDKVKKTECFDTKGKLFARFIIEYDENLKPIKEIQYVKNLDGTVLEYEGFI